MKEHIAIYYLRISTVLVLAHFQERLQILHAVPRPSLLPFSLWIEFRQSSCFEIPSCGDDRKLLDWAFRLE